MANENQNGGAPPGPEVVEVDLNDPVVATRFAQIGVVAERALQMFAPKTYEKIKPEEFQALILGMLREEMMLDRQVRPLFTIESAKENPHILLQLLIPGQPPIQFASKRRLEQCANAQEVLAQALIVAFTDNPGIRAVLRALGWQYMWLAPKQSRIILAKG